VYAREALILVGMASVLGLAATGAGAWCLAGRRPAHSSTYAWTGLAIALCLLPVFHRAAAPPLLPAACLSVLALAGAVLCWRARGAPGQRTASWHWLGSAAVLAAVALLLEVHYLRFRYLGWDAWWFWVPRAHFIYLDGLLSPAFWNVDHASYPPLVPMVTALFFHLQAASGEMTALTAYWVMAFIVILSFSERVDALSGRRGTGLAALLVFLLTPKFADSGLYYRELVSGHADLFWQLTFIAGVASGLRRGLRGPPSLDEAGLLAAAALMKEEAAVLALCWAALRMVASASASRHHVRPAVLMLAVVAIPVLGWKWLVVHQAIESRLGEYALWMPWERYAKNLAIIGAFLGKIELLPVLFPLAGVLALLPASRKHAACRAVPGLAAVIVLGATFVFACYVFYAGDSLQWLIDTTFGRLYGLPILAAIVLCVDCIVRAGSANP